jgi:hypothetical protein
MYIKQSCWLTPLQDMISNLTGTADVVSDTIDNYTFSNTSSVNDMIDNYTFSNASSVNDMIDNYTFSNASTMEAFTSLPPGSGDMAAYRNYLKTNKMENFGADAPVYQPIDIGPAPTAIPDFSNVTVKNLQGPSSNQGGLCMYGSESRPICDDGTLPQSSDSLRVKFLTEDMLIPMISTNVGKASYDLRGMPDVALSYAPVTVSSKSVI